MFAFSGGSDLTLAVRSGIMPQAKALSQTHARKVAEKMIGPAKKIRNAFMR